MTPRSFEETMRTRPASKSILSQRSAYSSPRRRPSEAASVKTAAASGVRAPSISLDLLARRPEFSLRPTYAREAILALGLRAHRSAPPDRSSGV
jgi:predicted naringenin-chalcone synthase